MDFADSLRKQFNEECLKYSEDKFSEKLLPATVTPSQVLH